jgi:hypothetical protein
MRASKVWIVVLALVALLFFPTVSAATPKEGDVIFGVGWAYNAPKADLDVRTGGLVANAEVFVSDSCSLRADYFRVRTQKEVEVPLLVESSGDVRTFLEESESNGFSLAVAPHLGNLSFPVGILGVSLAGDNMPEWGATAGAWLDFWATENIGVGFGASYQYLQNTELKQDFVDVRGALRFKF